MKREMNPVIRHTPLPEIIGADFLRAVTRADLASPKIRPLIMLFPLFEII